MSIESFHTAQNAQTTGKTASSVQGRSGITVLGGAAGLSFFDMFLRNALQTPETAKKTDHTKTLSNAAATNDLLSAQTSADGAEGTANTLEIIAGLEPDGTLISATQSDGQKISTDLTVCAVEDGGADNGGYLAVLKGFMLEDIAGNKPALNNLQRMLKRIESLMANDDPALISTNLTPDQITALQDRIEVMKKGEQPDNGEFGTFFIGFVCLLPPQTNMNTAIKGQALAMTPEQLQILQSQDSSSAASGDVSARLNPLSAPLPGDTGALWFMDDNGSSGLTFDKFLKGFMKGGKGEGAEVLVRTAAQNGTQPKTDGAMQTHVLQNLPFTSGGALFGTEDLSQTDPDSYYGLAAGQTHAGISGASTSLVTQSSGASQPHPATQMVAVQMQKAATSGEDKSIRLQLDPPELGRVEIRMSFGKDKAIKAVLSAEKPETFLMLQRDAHILERALQDAGLDAGAEGALSFELAQDGQNFGQDGHHDGSRHQAGNPGALEENTEMLDTTMTWHVDPQTGHMRYNITV